MQIVPGYSTDFGSIRLIQQFRLYHLSRPSVKKWRTVRHGIPYQVDATDQWILNNLQDDKLVAVDCAGWYFKEFNINATCLESDLLSKQYFPGCYVEPDIFIHRPTYIPDDQMVVFKYPWFLKYATLDQFINFLNTWVRSITVLNFDPIFIQHNHLKFSLEKLVRNRVDLNIQIINSRLWTVLP
jgi:hypothetical protein|tara:strand:+ start:259 stop:810 length:552 start_codon:yes stop_codon:yes gene_type:complete